MIALDSVSFIVGGLGSRRMVFDAIDGIFETGGNYVLFGLRGSGKTTLLRLLCGLKAPTIGNIRRYGSVSFPIGMGMTFTRRNTPRALATLYADLYQGDRHEILDFVASFSQMPDMIDLEFDQMSPEQKGRINHSFAYAIPADHYLFDGTAGVSDPGFRARCQRAFAQRRAMAGTIVTTSSTRNAAEWGDKGAVLFNGKLYLFDSVDAAREVFEEIDVQNVKSLDAQIKQLVSLGRFADAQAALQDHIADNRDDVAAYSMLADVSLKLMDFDQAVVAAGMMLDREPEAAEPYMILASVAQREGRLLDAIANAEQVVERSPENRDAKVIIARSYELLEMHSQAGVAWQHLAAPSAADVPLRLALRNYIRAEDWERIIDVCSFVGRSGDSDGYIAGLEAQALMELGRWEAFHHAVQTLAATDFDAAVRTIYRLTKKEEPLQLMRAMAALPGDRLARNLHDRSFVLMILHLKRSLVALRRADRTAGAREIEVFLEGVEKLSAKAEVD